MHLPNGPQHLQNPPRFRRRLHNVVVIVEPEPPRPGLLGLYHGRPLTVRSASDVRMGLRE